MISKKRILACLLAPLAVLSLPPLPANARTIFFQEKTEPIANPMKGWVIWGEDHTTPPQPLTLFFSYRSWRQIEPEEGRFDFESWERDVWDYWIQKGMKVIFRIYADYPGRSIGVPQWLLDAGLEVEPYDEYGGGWSPDYADPLFLEKARNLIAALGRRYDQDPRVAFLDVGILGHWGEWHTYPREELFASTKVQRAVADAFAAAFPRKKMMLRYPTLWSARMPFGYRDDCFLTDTDGPEDWYFFNRIRSAMAGDVWKTQPYGGEFCGGGEGAKTGTLEQPGECLRLIREGRFSHLGPAGGSIAAVNSDHQNTLDAMLQTMGYRLVLREADFPGRVAPGGEITLRFTLENTGAAPFYYPWPLEIVWFDGAQKEIKSEILDIDIRNWLPGAHNHEISAAAPSTPQTASAFLGLRIPDPDRTGPPVRFENIGEERDGAFILGAIEIRSESAAQSWDIH